MYVVVWQHVEFMGDMETLIISIRLDISRLAGEGSLERGSVDVLVAGYFIIAVLSLKSRFPPDATLKVASA